MKKQLIHSSILILLAAASAFAEQAIKAKIPFPFHLGESILPSGPYTMDSGVTPGVLRFRSADGKSPRGTPENRPMRDASKPANGIEAGQKHLYPTADSGDKKKVHIRIPPFPFIG
jgi:hypothetical protein